MRRRLVVQTLVDPAEPVDSRVDLVELRLDLYPDLDVAAFVAACDKPVIATVRRVRDGGAYAGGLGARAELFAHAASAAYFDLEDGTMDPALPGGVRVIRSFHDIEGVPEDLGAVTESLLLSGGDLFKLAVTPRSATEALQLLDLPMGGIGMGPFGAFTRVLAPLTYCASRPVAPGMPTPADLFDLYGIERLSGHPVLFGVAGDPIEHSESPALHNPALRRDALDAVYLPFRVDDLAAFWPEFVARGGRGLSVTAPLKQQAAALAAAPDEDVVECGAANTLLADGRAANTDLRAFLDLVPPGSGEALVMGAGGSARAAVVALRRLGYTVRVWARRREEARALGDAVEEPATAQVIVNTTPARAPDSPCLVDLRYGDALDPRASIDGRTFLRAQARHQYRLFTGGELD